MWVLLSKPLTLMRPASRQPAIGTRRSRPSTVIANQRKASVSAPKWDRKPPYNLAKIDGFEWSSFVRRVFGKKRVCQIEPEQPG
jgi:hypothetical protein